MVLDLAKKLLFALVPLVILLSAAEVVVRMTGAAERCPAFADSTRWACDPILGFKNKPDMLVMQRPLNAAGFRTHEFGPKGPGVFRILTLGDSSTFGIISLEEGWYIREPYPQRLERLLEQAAGPGKFEVLNVGVPGYNSYQGLMLLRARLRGLAPDLITVRFGWNDHFALKGRDPSQFQEPRSRLALAVQDLLLRTALYGYARRLGMELALRMTPAAPGPLFPTEWQPAVARENYKRNLRRIVEVGRGRGAQVWLVVAPSAFMTEEVLARYDGLPKTARARTVLYANAWPSFRRLDEIHASYAEATREVGAEVGAPVIDMVAAYRDRPGERLFGVVDVVHPTQAGHRVEAEALFDRMVAEGMVSPSSAPPRVH